jgi:hypothetical protein
MIYRFDGRPLVGARIRSFGLVGHRSQPVHRIVESDIKGNRHPPE